MQQLNDPRARLFEVTVPGDMLDLIAGRIASQHVRCPSLVIDSEHEREATGRPRDLAISMRATCVRLEDLDETSVLHLIRNTS